MPFNRCDGLIVFSVCISNCIEKPPPLMLLRLVQVPFDPWWVPHGWQRKYHVYQFDIRILLFLRTFLLNAHFCWNFTLFFCYWIFFSSFFIFFFVSVCIDFGFYFRLNILTQNTNTTIYITLSSLLFYFLLLMLPPNELKKKTMSFFYQNANLTIA